MRNDVADACNYFSLARKTVRDIIRSLLRGMGVDLVSFDPVNHPVARRSKLMGQKNIDLLLDVGANVGQYAVRTRDEGYRGRIVSFEPLSSAFAELATRVARDPLWEAVNAALGDRDETAEINVSSNSQSSSLLAMLPSHVNVAPTSTYVGRESIEVKRLDSVFGEYWRPGNNVFLKIDAQGYEKKIVEGGMDSLGRIAGVQMELSLVPLYEGETLLAEMIDYMSAKGFILMSVDPTYGNRETGQMLQADCMFFR